FLSIIFWTILTVPFNFKIYKNFYLENNTANDLNITDDKLLFYTENLLDYLKGNGSLDANWFTKKDILHMIDVKNIYSTSFYFTTVITILFLLSTFILLFLDKHYLPNITKKFKLSFAIFIVVLLSITLIVSINFNYFWIKFHEVIFTNDLWLLSPEESNLIKMFSENFFYSLVTKIIIIILVIFSSLAIINFILTKKLKIKK
ncbi:DUF1461 domain-containing protein, partial [Gemella sp. GH3]|uniref:lipoprotein intramolecular transacylase Lit n=1 Tax=unclassified Gemella TaxID=2624949 RepID=UPI0015CFC05D